MKQIMVFSLAIILFSGSIMPFLSDYAFGQLESISISGPKRVLKDSVFTFIVNAEGVSRASFGDFSVTLQIAEKESGNLVAEQPAYLVPGKNSFVYSGKQYSTGENKVVLTPNVPHVFRIYYLNQVWEYEFLPVDTVEELNEIKNKTMSTIKEKEPIQEEKITIQEKPDSSASVWVDWVESSSIKGRWIPVIEVCAGEQRLVSPEIIITSDLEEISIDIGYVISPDSCRQYNHAKIRADDVETIKVQFAEKDSSHPSNEVERLKAEIEELKNQLDKKDAILMEQLKVIQQLASSIQKTVFVPIVQHFTS